MIDNATLQDADRQHHLHPFTDFADYTKNGGRLYTRADGIHIYDDAGHTLLDGMSGLWCTNLGYSQQSIVDAVTEQLQQLPYYNSFFNCSNDAAARLAKQLTDYAPDGFSRVFFTNSGSEANDTNIRIAQRYWDLREHPEKKMIISRYNAYHGSTIAAGSLTGMSSMHKQFQRLPYVDYAMQPYTFERDEDESVEAFGLRAAQSVADTIDAIGAHKVAAFIGEPVQGAGGVIIPPNNYWPEVERILRERDVLFISDEVICGFGRTGARFGCQHFGVTPDLITFAKGVTNGYQPLGGVLLSDRVGDVLTHGGGEFAHGFTYSGHPAACAAGSATLALYETLDTPGYVADEIAPYWREQFGALENHAIVGEARTLGMLGALELVCDKPSGQRLDEDGKAALYCRNAAIDTGLMIRAVGDAMISAPPLICTREDVDTLVSRLNRALDETASHYGVNEAG